MHVQHAFLYHLLQSVLYTWHKYIHVLSPLTGSKQIVNKLANLRSAFKTTDPLCVMDQGVDGWDVDLPTTL